MVHDDIVWGNGPFLAPEYYRKYVFANYKKLFAPLHDCGKKILYTSDGNYSAFVDDVAACGVNGFVMEPATDMACIAEKYGKTHVFVGNADTSILLSGGREAIEAEVRRCMDVGRRCPGFVMAVGNHIPANTPVENCLIYNEFTKSWPGDRGKRKWIRSGCWNARWTWARRSCAAARRSTEWRTPSGGF